MKLAESASFDVAIAADGSTPASRDKKLRELIEHWIHNLEVLNAGVQGNHKFANRVIPSLYRLLEDSKK